jgi:hypothetical protein
MNNSYHRNIWCANAFVGAPKACGQTSYYKPVENFSGVSNKNDIINNYTNFIEEGYKDKCTRFCSNLTFAGSKKCKKYYETGIDYPCGVVASCQPCQWSYGVCAKSKKIGTVHVEDDPQQCVTFN